MAYTKITSDELVICANHRRYADTKNRACAEIYSLLETEHTDGVHDRNYAMVGEIDTFEGNGAVRTISLSNSDLDVQYLICWQEGASRFDFFRLDNFPAGKSCYRIITSIVDGYITDTGVGEFSVGTNVSVNENGETIHYLALGIDITSTYTQAGGGNDPDWVEDGEDGYGDGTGTSVANQVEDDMYTAFDDEHDGATGAHDSPPFSGFAMIEVGKYEGNGVDDRDILLAKTDLDIKYLFVFVDAANLVASRSESMAGDNTKNENAAAFAANYIQSIGTGTFQVGSANSVNFNTADIYYCALGI